MAGSAGRFAGRDNLSRSPQPGGPAEPSGKPSPGLASRDGGSRITPKDQLNQSLAGAGRSALSRSRRVPRTPSRRRRARCRGRLGRPAGAATRRNVTWLSPGRANNRANVKAREPATKMGSAQTTESFVTRIWSERGSDGEQVWRGHIRHVQSPEERYFEHLREMLDFMEHTSGLSCRSLSKDPASKTKSS